MGVQSITQETKEKTKEKILRLIAFDPTIATTELAKETGITRLGIEWQIRKLKETGVLERVGPNKGGHWKIIPEKDD